MAKVIIFSGAGVSAESGISTFRDSDGLWENYDIREICSAGCLSWNRDETIKFYDMRREDIRNKKPNYAHQEICKLKEKYPNDIAIITQNVDDMFEKAGCSDVLHLHGFLPEVVCESCGFKENIGYDKLDSAYSECPSCAVLLRPNIVFFGEAAPRYADLYEAFDDCEVFVVIGTSGNVINTDMFLNRQIKLSILNNLEPSAAINDRLYSKVLYKKATEAIDEIIMDIEDFLA
ncbi:MAG: NAD-dependent deacetylase [Campylobacterales bacterium]|nr:NAD-dependent deacetylase [Campylobacterales bacterium]